MIPKQYMSWVNLGEVYYMIQRRYGRKEAIELIENINAWPVELVEASNEQVIAAGDVKAKFPLALGDSYAAGLAIRVQGILLTADKEFEPLENQLLKIHWLAKHR